MKKIVIIGVYFGEFPSNYRMWLKSVEYNKTIDFKVFTNQKNKSNLKNLEYVYMDMVTFSNLVKKKLREDFQVNHPYKCCDYKPTYGIILSDYIKDYDFWGHCDFDMVFGDIRKFLTDDILNKYDKILSLGHLSLYRNEMSVCNRYKDKGSEVGDYDMVFTSDDNFAFDEDRGILKIYTKNHYPVYDKYIFADISTIRKRFTLAKKEKNYKYQVFYWEKGHVYRAYKESKIIKTDEFIYIHFKRRKHIKDYVKNDNVESFYICDKGIFEKPLGIPSIADIKKYNNYSGFINEFIENTKFKIKNYSSVIRRRLTK